MKVELIELINKIIHWLKKEVVEAGARGVVLGMSGGLDSSITAVLCKKAFPKNTLGFIMPCFSNPEDIQHAKQVAEKFNIETKIIDLSPLFVTAFEILESKKYNSEDSVATGNLKSRLRMLTLYYWANKLNYLVVGTGNKSELMIGYFTKYGDGGVDILPLGNILKTELKDIAKELGIPEDIINKPPSAGLWPGQIDEEEINITYEELDKILKALEIKDFSCCDLEKVKEVQQKIEKSRHKREKPKIFILEEGFS